MKWKLLGNPDKFDAEHMFDPPQQGMSRPTVIAHRKRIGAWLLQTGIKRWLRKQMEAVDKQELSG